MAKCASLHAYPFRSLESLLQSTFQPRRAAKCIASQPPLQQMPFEIAPYYEPVWIIAAYLRQFQVTLYALGFNLCHYCLALIIKLCRSRVLATAWVTAQIITNVTNIVTKSVAVTFCNTTFQIQEHTTNYLRALQWLGNSTSGPAHKRTLLHCTNPYYPTFLHCTEELIHIHSK